METWNQRDDLKPETKEEFQAVATKVFLFLQSQNIKFEELSKADQGLWNGVIQGWWEWVDWDRKAPIPFAIMINVNGCPSHWTMAHVLTEIGLFDSVSEARKNGWNKPIQIGELFLFKRTKRLIICSFKDDEKEEK